VMSSNNFSSSDYAARSCLPRFALLIGGREVAPMGRACLKRLAGERVGDQNFVNGPPGSSVGNPRRSASSIAPRIDGETPLPPLVRYDLTSDVRSRFTYPQ